MAHSGSMSTVESQLEFLTQTNVSIFGSKEYPLEILSKCAKCQNKWDRPQRIFICNTCSKQQNSCMCTNCFLKVDHTGHDYYIDMVDQGSCDCGDNLHFSMECTCQNHQCTDSHSYKIPTHIVDMIGMNIINYEIVKWVSTVSLNISIRESLCSSVINSIKHYFDNWNTITKEHRSSAFAMYSLYLQEYKFAQEYRIYFLDFIAHKLSKKPNIPEPYNSLATLFLYSINNIQNEEIDSLFSHINDFLQSLYSLFDTNIFESSQYENFLPLIYSALLSFFDKITHKDQDHIQKFVQITLTSKLPTVKRHVFKVDSNSFLPYATGELAQFLASAFAKLESKEIYIDIPENAFCPSAAGILNSLLEYTQSAPLIIAPIEYVLRCMLNSGKSIQNIGHAMPFVRFFSLIYLSNAGFFVRSSSRELIVVESLTSNLKHSPTVLAAFETFQRFFAQFEEKNKIITLIAHSLGVILDEDGDIYDSLTKENENSIFFSFFHFIASLFSYQKHSHKEFIEDTIKNYLFDESMSANALFETIPREIYDSNEYKEALKKLTSKTRMKFETTFKLKPNIGCNIYQPWTDTNIIKQNISKMITASKNKLIPFPEYQRGNFDSIFNSSIFLGIVYKALHSLAISRKMVMNETIHIIVHMLIISRELSQESESTEEGILTVKSFAELIKRMPSDFHKAMNTKIIFKDMPATSLRDLIKLTGDIGKVLFEEETEQNQPTKQKERNQTAANLRNKILEEFTKKSNSFRFDDVDEEDEGQECEVCHCPDLPLYFPLSMLKTSMAAFIDGVPQYESFGISFCQHLIHSHCAMRSGESYICPVDRIKRGLWLPFAPSCDSTVEISDGIPGTNSSSLAATIADCLAYLEFRANTETIESFGKNGQIRSLFAYLRTKTTSNEEDLRINNPFVQFIINLARSEENPKDLFEKSRGSFVEQNPIYKIRIQLLGFTVFGIDQIPSGLRPNVKIFDWLPKHFFDFMQHPYNLPLLEPRFNYAGVAICLLTRRIVAISGRFDGAMELGDYIKAVGGAGVLLSLGGQHATRIQVVFPDMASVSQLGSPYVDSDGDCDIGMRRGRPLSLSAELLEGITDSLFSMSFINQQ